jgi:hypothetical protein
MSSIGAERLTIFGRLVGVRHAFRIRPRGTLIYSTRLGFFACFGTSRSQVGAELCTSFER